MTKSTITRERLEEIVSDPMINQGSEFAMMARMALAAMDSSESVELPLDYLQGHKDGLEWAAQLAEANHPETGDWLYDDPIELAKAIRKGPDMPPAQPVADSEPVAYMTYKGYLLHAGDPKLAEYSEPMPLYADPRPEPISAEPVAWLLSGGGAKNVVVFDGGNAYADPLREVTPLYRHAQPASERDQVRSAHAEWSQATFGNVGPVGPLKHLSKEALEAAEQPGDLSEWADMQFLLWDAQRRAGITDDQITQAMIDKLAANKQREWPEPKDGEPRLHIKEQPAPVVPEEKPIPNTLSMYAVDAVAAIAEVKGWNACRAAMLNGGKS